MSDKLQSILLQEILHLIDVYIKDKHESKKWEAGKDWVQYAGPYYDSKEYVRAVNTLLNEWLVLGDEAIKFENQFPPVFGKRYGVLTNSGSSANLLMLLALTSEKIYNFKKGTKVITPIAGFPTTVNPILQVGFEPVFIDIELDTLNLDLDQLEHAIKNSGAKVLMFAHALGNPPNMRRVEHLVNSNNLILLEDVCDGLGSTYDKFPLGSFSMMASTSFYPAHHITMGEGGFVATETPELEKIVRSFREWGRGCYCVGKEANLLKNGTCKCRFNNWLPTLPNEIFDHKYVYDEIGYNLKPIELQASLGLVQMSKLPDIAYKRVVNYDRLFAIFSKYEEFFVLPRETEHAAVSWFAFPLTIKDKAPFKRSDICGYLEDNKIQTRPYFAGNLMLQPAYSQIYDPRMAAKNFPIATKVTTDTFFLGTSPVLSKEQLDYVGQIVDAFMRRYQ
jgi:CDP-6-deoxy-D-xylo-4-hexulose-3-dehydrase